MARSVSASKKQAKVRTTASEKNKPATAGRSRRTRKAEPTTADTADMALTVAPPGGETAGDMGVESNSTPPAKARRGRKSEQQSDANAPTAVKADLGTDAVSEAIDSVAPTGDETSGAKADNGAASAGSPRKGRRSAVQAKMKSGPSQPEVTVPSAPQPSAARWNADTATATFDWPGIEQVAATDGPNQAMAKLLLAARAEGANSRWPF